MHTEWNNGGALQTVDSNVGLPRGSRNTTTTDTKEDERPWSAEMLSAVMVSVVTAILVIAVFVIARYMKRDRATSKGIPACYPTFRRNF